MNTMVGVIAGLVAAAMRKGSLFGHLFTADGNSARAVDVRMAEASALFSKYTWIWKHSGIAHTQKLRLYFRVVQKLVYAHEAWKLTSGKGSLINKIRMFNARCLAVMRTHSDAGRRRKGNRKDIKIKTKYGTTRAPKGKSKRTAGRWTRTVPEAKITDIAFNAEMRKQMKTPEFDIVGYIRSSRLRWVGQLLAKPDDDLVRCELLRLALMVQLGLTEKAGGILMDVEDFESPEDLLSLAGVAHVDRPLATWSPEARAAAEESMSTWRKSIHTWKYTHAAIEGRSIHIH